MGCVNQKPLLQVGRMNATNTLVLGMGATGLSIAAWLARRGQSATFADSRRQPPGASKIAALLPDAVLCLGAVPEQISEQTEQVLISPGLGMNLPVLQDAERKAIPILSDIDLFMQECPGKVLGVTGSNGKSTVTSLLDCMLSAAGMRVQAGGNLGTPALDLLQDDAEVFVLELSSFQLERSGELPLHAAVILNVSPDHLDHHGDLESYRSAKQKIYSRCGMAIVNRDEPEFVQEVGVTIPEIGFGLGKPAARDWGVIDSDDGQWIARGAYAVMPVGALQIAGRHNLSNVLAAFALADSLEAPLDGLVAGAQLFAGLPHRMQIVAADQDAGVVWIDDSKATNEAAALASIRSVKGRLVLIAGGDAKGGILEEFAAELAERRAIVILLGKDSEYIRSKLAAALEIHQVETIEEAVSVAADVARTEYTVLLAPACSSLDMFSGYAERGERFAAAVRGLQS